MNLTKLQNQNVPQNIKQPMLLPLRSGLTYQQCRKNFYLGVPAMNQTAPTNTISYRKSRELSKIGFAREKTEGKVFVNGVINTQYKNQIIPDLALLDENISSSLTSALSNKAHPIHGMYSQYKDTRQHLYIQILANKPIEDLQVTQRLQLAELAALVLSPEFFNLVEDVSIFVQHTLPMLGQTIIILLEEDECFLKT